MRYKRACALLNDFASAVRRLALHRASSCAECTEEPCAFLEQLVQDEEFLRFLVLREIVPPAE